MSSAAGPADRRGTRPARQRSGVLYIQRTNMTKRPISAAERISRECLGMPLRMLHRAVSAVYDDALGGHGVGIAQLNLLVVVERLGEGATPSLISRVLMLEKSSVSREADRLVERGWMSRRTRADGRSQLLALNAQGRSM